MQLLLGSIISVLIRYVYTRNNTAYYQRKIPLDVQPLYDGLKSIKLNLETNNPSEKIARKVDALNKKYETTWEGLRDAKIITPHSVKDAAKKLLKNYDLNPLPARNPSLCQELLGYELGGHLRTLKSWLDKVGEEKYFIKLPH